LKTKTPDAGLKPSGMTKKGKETPAFACVTDKG